MLLFLPPFEISLKFCATHFATRLRDGFVPVLVNGTIAIALFLDALRRGPICLVL